MADAIVGVAVLDKSPGEIHHLFMWCKPEGKPATMEYIPVWPKGAPNKPDRAWTYEVVGDTLKCFPSVKISTTRPKGDKMEIIELFHNTYDWEVKFIEGKSDDLPPLEK